jgi:hypothetical protein
MSPEGFEFIQRRIDQVLHTHLATLTGSIDPDAEGRAAFKALSEADRKGLEKRASLLLEATFEQRARALTQPKPTPADDQGELFSQVLLNSWQKAAEKGLRQKYREGKNADDHVYRERQISNMRVANRRFDTEEERRKILREAGFYEDPEMTREAALRKLDMLPGDDQRDGTDG